MPQIAVMNESTAISGADVQKMLPAFQQQWNNDLRAVWGVDDASFVFVPKNHMPSAGSWWLVFGATHELCEMAVDPWLNSAYQDPKGVFWAGEVADPVESDQYGYKIGDILVTDFITPNWFAHEHAHGHIDFKNHAHKAFDVLDGGYAQKFDPNQGWVQITGSMARNTRRAHAAPGSRRERRTRLARGLKPSAIRRG